MLFKSLPSLLSVLLPIISFVTTTSAGADGASQIPLDASSPVYSSMTPPAAGTPSEEASTTAAKCLSAGDAAIVARDFGLLISNYTTELAVQLLADEFIDQADSVNTLINHSPLPYQPLGSLTFANKAEFLAGQGAQPPVPFTILRTWQTCDAVIIRWRSHQKPDQVQGVSIGEVRPVEAGEEEQGLGVGQDGKWVLKAVYAEFNSGAWLKNLGSPECEGKEHKGWKVEVGNEE